MITGHWKPEEVEYLRTHYVEQGSVEIGKALDRNPRAVSCMAYYLGLRRGWGKSRGRTYAINENIFKDWFMESAYLVGLILTDGNIVERELSIVSKDEELLVKARIAMGAEHPVTHLPKKDMYRIRIGHKGLIADLKAIGITERKSKTVRLPDIPDHDFFDFLRGYVDGDGMISYKPGKSLVLKLSTGSPFILGDISDTITRLLGIDRHEPRTRIQKRRETISTWYELTYCGECASRICEAMYDHAFGLYLSRKYEAFISYLNRPKNHGERNGGNATRYNKVEKDPVEALKRKRENARLRQARYREKLKLKQG